MLKSTAENRIVSVLEISDFLFAHRESLSSLNQCSDSVLSSDLADREMLFWFVTNTVLQNFSGAEIMEWLVLDRTLKTI